MDRAEDLSHSAPYPHRGESQGTSRPQQGVSRPQDGARAEPLPLTMTPPPALITRRALPAHSGHFFRGWSTIDWRTSKRLPLRSHSYS